MERKNTILLTVIAIATLLVAVVGATFAYFTATFTPTNKDNNTVNATTKTFVNTSFDYGTAATATNVVPGHKILKVMTVEGKGEVGAQAAKIRLTITGTSIPTELKDDIVYTLYKEDNIDEKNAVTCTQSSVTPSIQSPTEEGVVETRYEDTMTCTNEESATVVSGHSAIAINNGESKTLDINVDYNTKATYYLVVEYKNKQQTQDAQGKTFTVTLKAEPIA